MADDLVSSVDELLTQALRAVGSAEAVERLAEARTRLHGPLRLAIAGKVKAGKSTLLNAILGEELASTDAGECTKIVTWYQRGLAPSVLVHRRDGPPARRGWSRESGAIEVDLTGLTADDVHHVEVTWPNSRLRDLTIVDTPGIASISTEVSARAHEVLAADDGRTPVADAVLYLLRHVHTHDVRFLESFHDDELAHGTPTNSVGILSRADEIGSCDRDAMEVAERIASQYQADQRMRRLCSLVVPVNGLLAYAASTLREAEYAMLAKLASLPDLAIEELHLTVDRFASRRIAVGVTELERAHLLDRLGLFGVRLSLDLLRTRVVTSSSELAAELSERSGLNRLTSVLAHQFHDRSQILKARSALTELTAVLRAEQTVRSTALLGAVEQLEAGSHDFEEVRLLDALRSGALEVPLDRIAELDRLMGGGGHAAASRLGVGGRPEPEAICSAALSKLDQWQHIAEHPLSSRALQLAARTAIRTLEGLVATAGSTPTTSGRLSRPCE